MSFHKRSTNERALARHHLKRFPDAAAIPVIGTDVTQATETSIVPHIPAATRPATTPLVTVLPPIGTDKVPTSSAPTASEFVSESHSVVSVSSASPSISSTPSSVPPSVQVSSSSSPTPRSTPTGSSIASSTRSSQPDAANTGSPYAAKSHGVSAGTVGGIVAVILVLAMVVAGFFVRRRSQHRRAVKRNTWGAGLVPALENKRNTLYGGQDQSMARNGGAPTPQHLANVSRAAEMSQSPSRGLPGLAPPVSSYNPGSPPPVSPFVPASLRVPSLRSVAPSTPSSATSELAIVARTFIPSLPDELHIANGEQIHILNAYDDGWALCSNLRGDQGVVPLECLERSTSIPAEMQLQPQSEFASESNRTSRRMSSLTPHVAGTY